MKDTCEACGFAFDGPGYWPFCKGDGTHDRLGGYTVVPDSIPGGVTLENLDAQPRTFYSRSDIARFAAAKGLRPMVRHAPTPGTDKSPHTQRWV